MAGDSATSASEARPANPPAEDSGGYDPTRPIQKGNPPRKGMIKEGEVRNPDGRRGKDRTRSPSVDPDMVTAALEKALQKKVPVTRNGKKGRATMLEALCEQVSTEAVGGDPDARKLLTQLLRIRNAVRRQSEPADQKALAPAAEVLDEVTALRIIDEFLRLHGVEDSMQTGLRPSVGEGGGDAEPQAE